MTSLKFRDRKAVCRAIAVGWLVLKESIARKAVLRQVTEGYSKLQKGLSQS
jgi:hypothetical protein